MRNLNLNLNQRQKVRLEAALQDIQAVTAAGGAVAVAVSDSIPIISDTTILRGLGTTSHGEEMIASQCGIVERINQYVRVRPHRTRYRPDVGDIVVGRVIEIVPKRWKLEINYSQDAILMLSSMNMTDGVQRRKTADDELNMRSIFEENDVICAEIRDSHQDGTVHLQARSEKYGKLVNGQLLTVPVYLVKRRKQHFHHLEDKGIDLILGCNGMIWVGEHAKEADYTGKENQEVSSMESNTPLETRQHICRIANAIRVLSALGFTLTVDVITETAAASLSSNVDISDMLGAEFYVQTAEREAKRRAALVRKPR